MLSQATETIRGAVAELRPRHWPDEFAASIELFSALLAELLLRGSIDPPADARRLVAELGDDGVRRYVRVQVVAWELGRIVATISYLGSDILDDAALATLWPRHLDDRADGVAGLALAVQTALHAIIAQPEREMFRGLLLRAHAGWSIAGVLLRKRERGGQRDRPKESLIAMAVHEEMFTEKATPYEMARIIAEASDGKMSWKSAHRRMKTQRSSAPEPMTWKTTLWHARVQALHVANLFSRSPVTVMR